jgi:hypothetical protein
MPRDIGLNIYYECDITNWGVDVGALISWCEQSLEGRWNVVSDSGAYAVRGDGRHCVTFLCDRLSDRDKIELYAIMPT